MARSVVTLIGVALLVGVLAGYLIHITLILRHVVLTLDVVLDAVMAVTDESTPIGEVTDAINSDLDAGRRALEEALGQLSNQEQSPSVGSAGAPLVRAASPGLAVRQRPPGLAVRQRASAVAMAGTRGASSTCRAAELELV